MARAGLVGNFLAVGVPVAARCRFDAGSSLILRLAARARLPPACDDVVVLDRWEGRRLQVAGALDKTGRYQYEYRTVPQSIGEVEPCTPRYS